MYGRTAGSVFLLLCLFNILENFSPNAAGISKTIPGNYTKREPRRFFNLLNLVRFENNECVDGSNNSGVCYAAPECMKQGGKWNSPCARGFGVCCMITRSCHSRIHEKVAYFRNPSYPDFDASEGVCDVQIDIQDSNVCQVRLDFLHLSLDQPVNGECNGDRLRISVSGASLQSIPLLCGSNSKQHVYLEIPKSVLNPLVTLLVTTNSVGDYKWNIRATQIQCQSQHRQSKGLIGRQMSTYDQFDGTLPAPSGCLQYYTEPNGFIESFNFGSYINNLDYTICIMRHVNICKITYTADKQEWSVGEPRGVSGSGDGTCTTSYVLIPGGSVDGKDPTRDRYCGDFLNYADQSVESAPVVSSTNGPFLINFHSTDSDPTPDTERLGFHLKYEQSGTNC